MENVGLIIMYHVMYRTTAVAKLLVFERMLKMFCQKLLSLLLYVRQIQLLTMGSTTSKQIYSDYSANSLPEGAQEEQLGGQAAGDLLQTLHGKLLSYCVSVWCASCTDADKKSLQRVVSTVQKIILSPPWTPATTPFALTELETYSGQSAPGQ